MKKIIALILVAVFVLAALISCTGENDNGDTDVTTNSGKKESALYVADYLPDNNYNGADFNIYTFDEASNMYTTFDCEADVTNKVLAAQYKRNRLIEDRFGVKFTQELTDSIEALSSTLVDNATVGDDIYHLNMLIQREAFSKATEGYVVRTGSLTYCHTDEPWYVKDINDELTVGGISFFAYTDECLNLFAQTDCVVYNKRIAEDLGIKTPYEHVDDDTWTLDNFYEAAKKAVSDLDGDTVIDDNDQLGIVAEGDVLYASLWIGAGLKTIEKDEDDIPQFTAGSNEKLIDVCSDIMGLLEEEGIIYDTTTYFGQAVKYSSSADQRSLARDVFVGGNSLFRVQMIGKLAELNDMTDDFGIVPCPKLDETQTQYHSRSCDGWIYVVPSQCEALEMTSIVLEALGVESKNYVYDAFYEESLKDRYTNDTDGKAKEMLDLISSTRAIDLGDTIWQNNCRNKMLDVFWSGSDTFSSSLAQMKMMAQLMIELAIDDLHFSFD